jgi:hypothetical protein
MELTGFPKTRCILSFKKVTGSFTEILEPMEKLLHAPLMVSLNQITFILIEQSLIKINFNCEPQIKITNKV